MHETNTSSAVIFWNTWYRANPQEQLEHLQIMREDLRQQGVEEVLFALSEVTHGQPSDLYARLEDAGYHQNYCPVSDIKGGSEGLCIARPTKLENTQFRHMITARAIANTKTRWIGETVFNGVKVFTTHASYPQPTRKELGVMKYTIEQAGAELPLLLGGDFNTLRTSKPLLQMVGSVGLEKLVDKGAKRNLTVPIGRWGIDLDHAFVSQVDIDRFTLHIGEKGPSNHRPLIVKIASE